ITEYDLKVIGFDGLAAGIVVKDTFEIGNNGISKFGCPALDRYQGCFLRQPAGDEVFDLAVLDGFDAAGDLDALVFRHRYLRHHLDVNVKLDRLAAVDLYILNVIYVEMR